MWGWGGDGWGGWGGGGKSKGKGGLGKGKGGKSGAGMAQPPWGGKGGKDMMMQMMTAMVADYWGYGGKGASAQSQSMWPPKPDRPTKEDFIKEKINKQLWQRVKDASAEGQLADDKIWHLGFMHFQNQEAELDRLMGGGRIEDSEKKTKRFNGFARGPAPDPVVEEIKELQRTDPDFKLAWEAHCEQVAGGKRDPKRHSNQFLSAFLNEYKAKGASGLPQPDTSTRPSPELIESLKELQRTEPQAKSAWEAYCRRFGRGIKDPSGHEAEFIEKFVKAVKSGDLSSLGLGPAEAWMPNKRPKLS